MASAGFDFPEETGTEKDRITWLLHSIKIGSKGPSLRVRCLTTGKNATNIVEWLSKSHSQYANSRPRHPGTQTEVNFGTHFATWLQTKAGEHNLQADSVFHTSLASATRARETFLAKVAAERARLFSKIAARDGHAGCFECGRAGNSADGDILEFSHELRGEKVATVSSLLMAGKWIEAEEEAEKCKIRCLLHRRVKSARENSEAERKPQGDRNAGLQQIRRDKLRNHGKERFIEAKLKLGCCAFCSLRCTAENARYFDFDHRDPTQKAFAMSDMVDLGDEIFTTELAKCRLLCAKCHRRHTATQRDEGIVGAKRRATYAEKNKRKAADVLHAGL